MSSATASVATGARLVTPSIFTRTFMLGIVGTLSAYLASWENADRLRDTYLEKNRDYGDTFDFIIVGAGTAGAIIANRLSEKYKVLLLEAGGEPHPFQAVPLLSNYLLNYAELDWRHVTMPQKQAFRGSVQSRASISQGRGLGGTSNLDYLMYLRGHPQDFDSWAELAGVDDPSWSYKGVLKYFKSLEQYAGQWNPENHGDSGELKIRPPSFTGLGQQFCEAAEANGYKQTDLNSYFTEGCDIINYPSKKGYRDSVYNSFLRRNKDRRTLAIHKYAHVNKILIRGISAGNDSAYGVEYDRHGKTNVAYAKKEIIISAGALGSSKILLNSGIGPKADLESIGIPVKADLPVGKNLQDHLSVFLGPFFVDNGRSLNIDRDVSAGSVLSLAKDGGPLTTSGFQAAAIVSSGLEKLHGGRNWPDLQLTMYGLAHHKSVEEDFSHAYKLKKDLLKTYLEHSKGLDSFSIVVSGGRPKSTGTVKLLNRNPYAPLIINPNYFDKIYDVVVMVDGIKKALRIVENSTVFFNDLNTRFTRQVLPGCEMYRFRSDAYFECYARTMSVSLGNVAGTAPMGTVLNSKLQVKGIKNLRVMDASVMPSIVTTSTGAAVMMIAEKGADMLLNQYEGSSSEASLLKDTNLVLDKIKESATHVKLGLDSSKALLDSLKLATSTSKSQPLLSQFNLNDLQKLTKSVGSLASILDPLPAGSIVNNVYTGSFDLSNSKGNATSKKFNPLAAIAGLRPVLKSQLGGLYQNLFDEEHLKSGTASVFTTTTQKAPVGQSSKGTPLYPTNDPDPMKLIQTLIKSSMKEIEKMPAMTSPAGSSLKNLEKPSKSNMTLDDIFGIVAGGEDAFEDYLLGEALKLTSPPKASTTTTTTTRKPVKVTKPPSTTTATPKEVITTTTRKPLPPTTKTTTTTTKKPFIDYSYEVLPVPLTKSKDVSSLIAQASTAPGKPVYSKSAQVQTIQIKPSPIPLSNVQTYKVPPVPGPLSGFIKPEVDSPKIKNLEALAQIQHETLTKLRQKQHRKPPIPAAAASLQFGTQNFRNPPPPPFPPQMLSHTQYQHLSQQAPTQPEEPSVNILPPPPRGRYPVPNANYYQQQQQQGTNSPTQLQQNQHPVYSQMLRPVHPYTPDKYPSGLLRAQPQPPVDPSNLKSAVTTIMNAKYAPPSVNPFASVLNVFGKPREQQQPEIRTESSVLKSLQLRANVDKFINYPYSAPVSPIPITHRPTPPPRTYPTTLPPPPPPMGLEELNQEDAGIFAPIKDMLQPLKSLSSIMKGPLSLLPNPFRIETETTTKSSIASSLLPSFLSSSLFSQRLGPISPSSYEPSESQVSKSQQPFPVSPANPSGGNRPLSMVLPRFFMNQTNFNGGEISPEQFILALANLTTDLPKPFVLEPSKTFSEAGHSKSPSAFPQDKKEEKGKKLLDDSISEILSQLQNHHFASLASSNSHLPADEYNDDITTAVEHSAPSGNNIGINSANEILHMDYRRFPTTVKASVVASTPKVKTNPPVEFHKSIWAKEPSIPSKSLHFKIKIV